MFDWAKLRDRIFRYHLPLVFQVIRYADKRLIEEFPFLNELIYLSTF